MRRFGLLMLLLVGCSTDPQSGGVTIPPGGCVSVSFDSVTGQPVVGPCEESESLPVSRPTPLPDRMV